MKREYYIAIGKDHLGPFTLSELKEKKLVPDSLVWYDGLEHWTRIAELEELKEKVIIVPSTPSQIKLEEQKIKFLIKKKILAKSIKKSAVLFLAFFILFLIIHYLTRHDSSFYYTIDNVIEIAVSNSLSMALYIFIISLPIFYFIEYQCPYNRLLTNEDKTKSMAYKNIIKRQEGKYIYDKKLDSTPVVWGYIILGLSLMFGIFPEFKIFYQLNDDPQMLLILLIPIGIRFIGLFYVGQLAESKNRKLSWGFFGVIFPSIALIIVGSLYALRKPEEVKNEEIEQQY